MKCFLAGALLFAATAICEADGSSGAVIDGNSLSEGLRLFYKGVDGGKLTQAQSEAAFSAVSFVHGFLGGCGIWDAETPNAPFKFPKEGLGTMQFVKIVNKYLQDHPEKLHIQAEFLVYLALRDSFPNPDYREPPKRPPSE